MRRMPQLPLMCVVLCCAVLCRLWARSLPLTCSMWHLWPYSRACR